MKTVIKMIYPTLIQKKILTTKKRILNAYLFIYVNLVLILLTMIAFLLSPGV